MLEFFLARYAARHLRAGVQPGWRYGYAAVYANAESRGVNAVKRGVNRDDFLGLAVGQRERKVALGVHLSARVFWLPEPLRGSFRLAQRAAALV